MRHTALVMQEKARIGQMSYVGINISGKEEDQNVRCSCIHSGG